MFFSFSSYQMPRLRSRRDLGRQSISRLHISPLAAGDRGTRVSVELRIRGVCTTLANYNPRACAESCSSDRLFRYFEGSTGRALIAFAFRQMDRRVTLHLCFQDIPFTLERVLYEINLINAFFFLFTLPLS